MLTRDERSAGGVVFRLRDDGGFEVALIRTHEGRWQLPKGWIEADEAPERTALREVREEAGVDAEVVGPLDTIKYTFTSTYEPDPVRVRKQVQFFLMRYLSGSTDDHDDEVTEARWFEIVEAERVLAFKDEKRLVGAARQALERVANER